MISLSGSFIGAQTNFSSGPVFVISTNVLKELYRLIRNAGKRKRSVGITKEKLFKTRGWGRGMKWTPYRQRLLSHGAIYDVGGEIPMYFFKADASKSYQETDEYELWLELIRRQEKQDKKTMSKLMNRRISTHHKCPSDTCDTN